MNIHKEIDKLKQQLIKLEEQARQPETEVIHGTTFELDGKRPKNKKVAKHWWIIPRRSMKDNALEYSDHDQNFRIGMSSVLDAYNS